MVKHTQTIRRLFLTNYLSVFDHFLGLALKGLRKVFAVMGQNRRFHFYLTTQGKCNNNPAAVKVMNNFISKLMYLGK